MPTKQSNVDFGAPRASERARASGVLCLAVISVSVCAWIALTIDAPRAFAQADSCAALQAAERRTYGFDPVSLSDSQRSAKTQEVQQFWGEAKGMGAPAVPCLRQMLASDKQDSYFLYSGSSLLLSLDSSPESLSAISTVLANVDTSRVDVTGYIGLLIKLARRNVDIGPLAEKYVNYLALQDPEPAQREANEKFINVAVLLYGSMPPDVAVSELEDLLKDGQANARPAAVFALALNLTEPAFRELHGGVSLAGLSDDDRQVVLSVLTYTAMAAAPHTPFSRDEVLRRLDAVTRGDFAHIDPQYPPYVSGDQAFEVSAGAQLMPADLPRLLEARRMSIHGVTDDSLDEYLTLTRTILEVINRYDLYKKWRMPAAEVRKVER
jgi:hypothetical protein